MLSILQALFAAVLLSLTGGPIVWSEVSSDGITVAMDSAGDMVAMATDDVGGVIIASTTDAVPQGQGGGPSVSTQWIDAAGVTHTITTPIASTTEAGINRAVETHETLVRRMQQLHPPRPVTPRTP